MQLSRLLAGTVMIRMMIHVPHPAVVMTRREIALSQLRSPSAGLILLEIPLSVSWIIVARRSASSFRNVATMTWTTPAIGMRDALPSPKSSGPIPGMTSISASVPHLHPTGRAISAVRIASPLQLRRDAQSHPVVEAYARLIQVVVMTLWHGTRPVLIWPMLSAPNPPADQLRTSLKWVYRVT